jgi:hypothetical protein
MVVFERRCPVPVSADELYAWHARPGALQRLVPPWERVALVSQTGGVADGRVVMRNTIAGPIKALWVAQHGDHVPGRRFTDVQEQGPFTRWAHTHAFEPTVDGSELVDHIEYQVPLGPLGQLVAGRPIAARLDRMFDFRHQRTREDLARHSGAPMTPLRIAVTGASGLIGTQLCAFLTTGGHTVLRLVRREAGPGEVHWDPARNVDAAALEGVDAVIHLAGESVASGRWTPALKDRILKSRTEGTRTLASALATLDKKPRVFLSASAIGYYGDTGDTLADESSPTGKGFLAEVCKAWEGAADPARLAGIPVVHPRIGVVLSGAGGALAQMRTPFAMGVGGPVGGGQQWLSWIAMDDTIGALHHLLHAGLEGPVNLVSPNPVRQAEFAKLLGKVLRRPAFLPLPAAAVRAIFGEMGQDVLLNGQRVAPTRLQASGFKFLREDLEGALRFELGR